MRGEKGRFRLDLSSLCWETSKQGHHEDLGMEASHFYREQRTRELNEEAPSPLTTKSVKF